MKGQSWQEKAPYHVSIEFGNMQEARDLKEELIQWTPSSGWSPQAIALFKLLANPTSINQE